MITRQEKQGALIRPVEFKVLTHSQRMFCKIYSYVANPVTGVTEPTAQPTSMVFSNITKTSFDVSFTAAVGGADLYLAVRRASASPTFVPSDLTGYTLGEAVGDGEVRHFGAGLTFSESGLSAYTEYFYDIFSCNGGAGTYNYLTTSPLENSQRTLFDFGNCLRYDTVNDLVTHTVNNFLGGRTTFSFAGWVIFDEAASFDMWREVGGGNLRARLSYVHPNVLRVEVQSGLNINVTFNYTITLGAKLHIGVTFDGAVASPNGIRLWVDGSELSIAAGSHPSSVGVTNVPIQFGQGVVAFRANNWAFWSDADANHITNHYGGGLGATPDATNLIKYNKFNGSNPSTVLVDETGTDNGTLVNFNFNASSGWEAWP